MGPLLVLILANIFLVELENTGSQNTSECQEIETLCR